MNTVYTLEPEIYDEETSLKIKDVETMLSLGVTGKHWRAKLKELAKRTKNPEQGRHLFKNLYMRLDSLGNPELISDRNIVIRFLVESIKIPGAAINHRDLYAHVSQIIRMYTDYDIVTYPLSGVFLKDHKEVLKDFKQHRNMANDGCSACLNHPEFFDEIRDLNDLYDRKVEELKIEVNDLGYIEFPTSNNLTVDLPSFLAEEYREIQSKRGWERKQAKEV